MDLDINIRIDDIARHLDAAYSGGQSTVGVEDELREDLLLADEIADVLDLTTSDRSISEARALVLDALLVMQETWSSGFDLASGLDATPGGNTVAGTICEYVFDLDRGQAPRAAAMGR